MGKIGSFGGVTFEVSANKVLTFGDLTRSGEARWTTHDVRKKPIAEFLGPGQESVNIKITLNRSLGVDPDAEIKKLRSFRDSGKTGAFVIGSKPISSNYWYISGISEGYKTIDGKGRTLELEIDLSLQEYANDIKVVTTKKPKPKKKKTSSTKRKQIGTITIKVGMLNCRASRSLKGRIVKVLKYGQKYPVYGIKTTDIPWYDLGGGKYTSAVSKYTAFKKG